MNRTRIVPVLVLLATSLVASEARADRDGEGLEDVQAETPKPPPPPPPTPSPDSPPREGSASTPVVEKPLGPWSFGVYGYLRAGYDYTTKDDRYDFIGRNNGFVLDAARVGLQGRNTDYGLLFRISVEAASGELVAPNTPIGTLAVRARDAFARWDPSPFVGIQVGQFKAPFQEEELRGQQDLMFASRAVGVEGVLPGRGLQTPGIQLDRQLGLMISPDKPIGTSEFGGSYYLMVMNGNGPNQLLDDNGKPGFVGRVELEWVKHVRLGAAVFKNDRTVGQPPNLYDEQDLGLTADLDIRFAGLEIFGAATRLTTVFPTVGTSERDQIAWQAQAGYRFDLPGFFITPAYRYAYFDPWAKGGEGGFDTFKVQYHTFGVRVGHRKLPIQAWLNYTHTGEDPARALSNERIQVLGQVTF